MWSTYAQKLHIMHHKLHRGLFSSMKLSPALCICCLSAMPLSSGTKHHRLSAPPQYIQSILVLSDFMYIDTYFTLAVSRQYFLIFQLLNKASVYHWASSQLTRIFSPCGHPGNHIIKKCPKRNAERKNKRLKHPNGCYQFGGLSPSILRIYVPVNITIKIQPFDSTYLPHVFKAGLTGT